MVLPTPKRVVPRKPTHKFIKPSKPRLEIVTSNRVGIKKRIIKVLEKDRVNLMKFLVSEKLTARELKQLRIPLIALRKAYLSVRNLHDLGYSMKEIIDMGQIAGMSMNVKEFKDAGYPIEDFVSSNVHLYHIVYAGFKAPELRLVGITAKRLQEAKFTNDVLRKLGFSERELK